MTVLSEKLIMDSALPDLPFHPCIHPMATKNMARIHLSVAGKCNLICRYCARQYPNTPKGLPGTARRVLSPEEALDHLRKQRRIWGHNVVVGISGPGEPLANTETFETLKLIQTHFPTHPLCICTNGLLLGEYISALSDLGISVISITINGVDPEIVGRLQPGVQCGDSFLMGKAGAQRLIDAQIRGLEMASAIGIFVKVNTVVAERINDNHLVKLASVLRDTGAGMMNIMPVIPVNKGFPLSPPDGKHLEELRTECEKYLPQFRQCRQCTSDAAGIPGLLGEGGCS